MDLSGYNIHGDQDIARVLASNNVRWISLRWYYITLLAIFAGVLSFISTGSFAQVIQYAGILIMGYVVNLFLLTIARVYVERLWLQRFVLVGQLLLDLAMCGLVTYVQGGIEARTTLLFAIPIVASGLMFTRQIVLPVTLASGVVYVGTLLLHGYIMQGSIDWAAYVPPIVFYPLLFLVLGRIVEFLTTIEINDARERAYDSFLSLLAHQLKHPASASKAIVDVIEHDKRATYTSQTRHYLQLLRGENDNQIRLIDNLLEAAPHHQLEVHREHVDIGLLLEKVAHKTAQMHQRTEDLVRERTAGRPIKVYGDSIKLRLALTNIFDNSFRHTTDGSSVHYGIAVKSGVVEITIRDEGVGMSKKHLEAIEQRFTSTNLHDLSAGHVGGLGLGLFIARQIVTAHDGTIEVQSKEGRGTTVTIRIKGAK